MSRLNRNLTDACTAVKEMILAVIIICGIAVVTYQVDVAITNFFCNWLLKR